MLINELNNGYLFTINVSQSTIKIVLVRIFGAFPKGLVLRVGGYIFPQAMVSRLGVEIS